ncbi:MAG: gfo/Idh/MocA family oxidoreductase, partial [Sphingomonas sp.]
MPDYAIAIIGFGKIARDQHVPAILGSERFSLAATVDSHGPGMDGVPHFESLEALLDS